MEAPEEKPSLTPQVEVVRCVVCGAGTETVVCSEDEVRAHFEYLWMFHRRRLRSGPNGVPPRSALETRTDFTQHYATDIVACTECGLLCRNPRPSAQAIRRAYASEEYGARRLDDMFAANLRLYRPKVRRLRRYIDGDHAASVVEVGSFVGGFLAAGSEFGWNMLGVDVSEEMTAYCESRGLRTQRGTLADAEIEPGSLDCVAIWNTFDQLTNPESTLAAACKALRPGGCLVLRVPNGNCFRLGARWMHRLPRGASNWIRASLAWNNLLGFPYLYGYSPRTLDRLLARYGFQRVALHPDTLVRLSDEQTKLWASWEERLLKLSCRIAWYLETLRSGSVVFTAPWFDAYYYVGAVVQAEPELRAQPSPQVVAV
jgi:SAM-dependent methyltransferase